jgi:glycosyltransferase involved in cell wall biosynthesis|tara:strand:+ start:241 stop:1425 length:1185 start_codon:yes stop_codon:yes gene_type:complete
MTNLKDKDVVYLTYDGLLDAIGQSQIVPYILELSEKVNFTIISLEKKEYINTRLHLDMIEKFKSNKIRWLQFRYYKRNLVYLNIINILLINIFCFYKLIFKKNKPIFHLRSYIPFFFIFFPLIFIKFKYIFDMRGFWPQEKIDRSKWKKNSFLLNLLFFFEKKILSKAYKIICLTNHSIKILLIKYPKIEEKKYICIRTCVDTNIFYPLNKKVNIKNMTLGYFGTTKGAYNLSKVLITYNNLLKFYKRIKLIIVTLDDPNKILDNIKNFNINSSNIEIYSANYLQMNYYLNNIDIGIFYLKENQSIKASFPTRIAEFLACNKPIICNNFNEDISEILEFKKGIIYNFKDELDLNFVNTVNLILKNNYLSNYCRDFSIKNLSLKEGSKNIYTCYC